MASHECQSMQIQRIAHGKANLPPLTVYQRLKLELRRKLSPERYRWLKRTIDRFSSLVDQRNADGKSKSPAVSSGLPSLQAGDRVKVKSAVEVEATLDRWKEYKGCGFMDDMWEFCDTEQCVLKPVRRFVDERDYQVKNVKGIVLLEGLNCKGTPIFGRCDRNCHYFWREEWLEKIDQSVEPNRPI
jgi:hypothetical protein